MRGGDGTIQMVWGTNTHSTVERNRRTHRKVRPIMDTRAKSSTATTKSDSGAMNKPRVIVDRSYSK